MMKTITRLLPVLILAVIFQTAQAQDIHFSQFYASPLSLNPAMTGNLNGSYRASVAYRNQWSSIPAPYSTVAGSFDMSLLGCQLGNDHIGVGLLAFNDRSGDGILTNNTVMGSVAYHKGLDSEGRYRLAAGVQAGYVQKKIDFTNLKWESQFVGFTHDPTVANGEPIYDNRIGYFDLRVGGLFTASVNEKVSAYAGGAYYHLLKPEETFLVTSGDTINELDPRLVFHAGASIMPIEKFSISPSVLYQSQTGNQEAVFGAAFGYHFNQNSRYSRNSRSDDGSAIYLGGWYRWKDAIILLLGVDFKSVKFGFSYDINISDLDVASLNQGGVELSLMYTGKTAECEKSTPLYCPRF